MSNKMISEIITVKVGIEPPLSQENWPFFERDSITTIQNPR